MCSIYNEAEDDIPCSRGLTMKGCRKLGSHLFSLCRTTVTPGGTSFWDVRRPDSRIHTPVDDEHSVIVYKEDNRIERGGEDNCIKRLKWGCLEDE